LHSLDEFADGSSLPFTQPTGSARFEQHDSDDSGLLVPVEAFSLISVIRSLFSGTDACDSSVPADSAASDPLPAEPNSPALIEQLLSLRDLAGASIRQLQDQLRIQQAQCDELAVLREECSRRYFYIQRCEEYALSLSSLEHRNAELHEQLTAQRTSHEVSIRDLDARLSKAQADAHRLRMQLSAQQQQQAAHSANLEADLQEAQARCADLQAQLSLVCLELERYYLLSADVSPVTANFALASESVSPSLIADREAVVINQNRSRLLISV
jgi:exonuclease VII large subunit